MREKIGKKGMKKRLIRVILSLATVVTLLHLSSINVYAAEVPVSTWSEFTNALSSTSSGAVIILNGDLTATSSALFNASDKEITIDLNGHTINLNGKNVIDVDAGTLIIKDDSEAGKITGSNGVEALGVSGSATLVLEEKSGSITGNSPYGIYIKSASAQFEMKGGHITGNTVANISGVDAITEPANVRLLGGEISGAPVGVNVRALTLGGTIQIKNNSSGGVDKSIWVRDTTMGDGVTTVIKLATGKYVPKEGMEVYVYSDKPVINILTSGADAKIASYFKSEDHPYRVIVPIDGALVLMDKRASNLSELKNNNSVKLDDVPIREASRIAIDKKDQEGYKYNPYICFFVYQKSTGGKYKVCVLKESGSGYKYESYDYPLAELIRLANNNKKAVYVVGIVLNHAWEYSVGTGEDVNKLTASCSGSCGLDAHSVSLTLTANDAYYSGEPYTGASLGDTSVWTGEGVDLIEPEIKYVGRGSTIYAESTTAPTEVGTYTARINVEGKIATKDFAITARTSSSDSESTKVFVDLDTNKSEVAYGTVFMHNKDNVRNIFDMKVHSVDARTKANQEFLAASYAKNQGKRARVLLTTGIYPRNKLYAKDLGDKKFLSFVNLEKKVQPVYAVCYNQTDKAYYLTGTMNANGTAVFPDFTARDATNITIFVLE